MTEAAFQSKYFKNSDGLSLYYRDYPNPSASKTILCLHGLTRNSRDYEELAPILQEWGYRVLCLEFRGRGKSEYDPRTENYHTAKYAEETLDLLAHEGLDQVILIGTSLGGVVAMTIGLTRPDVMSAVVLNDIGPDIEAEGLQQINKYVGVTTPLPDWNVAAGAAHLVGASAYPTFTDEDWFNMAKRLFVELEDGSVRPDYDAGIADMFHSVLPDEAAPDLWEGFAGLKGTPVLLIHGELSNILSKKTVNSMKFCHPKMEYLPVANRGHVPLMTEKECLEVLTDFLGKSPETEKVAEICA